MRMFSKVGNDRKHHSGMRTVYHREEGGNEIVGVEVSKARKAKNSIQNRLLCVFRQDEEKAWLQIKVDF